MKGINGLFLMIVSLIEKSLKLVFPKGLFLAPLLCLVYINDLPDNILEIIC